MSGPAGAAPEPQTFNLPNYYPVGGVFVDFALDTYLIGNPTITFFRRKYANNEIRQFVDKPKKSDNKRTLSNKQFKMQYPKNKKYFVNNDFKRNFKQKYFGRFY